MPQDILTLAASNNFYLGKAQAVEPEIYKVGSIKTD